MSSVKKGASVEKISRTKEEAVTVLPVTTPEVAESPSVETPTRVRREVTSDVIDTEFTELCAFLELELARHAELKENGVRTGSTVGGVKFLRSVLKRTRQLQHDVQRMARKKRGVPRQGDYNNSGFMKEALLSDEMATFLKVPRGSSMSRVECTRKLQQYIIANNLQNPDNRREIMPDKTLAKLLKYNKAAVDAGGHGPLYYYIMQRLIQQHFAKVSTPTSV